MTVLDKLIPHLKYLRYTLLHKWYVFVECCKLGIPIRGLLHDLSKFTPSEWGAYVEYFYGNPKSRKRFRKAWLHHQNSNEHHWQYYVIIDDDGSINTLPMPDKYRRELVADWIGAGKAKNKTGLQNATCKEWYEKRKNKLMLHPETRRWIENILGNLDD